MVYQTMLTFSCTKAKAVSLPMKIVSRVTSQHQLDGQHAALPLPRTQLHN